jgi:hypothetical protein
MTTAVHGCMTPEMQPVWNGVSLRARRDLPRSRHEGTAASAAPGVERLFERFAVLPEDQVGLEAFRRLASEADTDVVGAPLAESHPL